MVESTIEPTTIHISAVKNGLATLRCRWNISFVEIAMPIPRSVWQYEEAIIKWALPITYDGYEISESTLPTYLNSIESEIINYAKGTKLNW